MRILLADEISKDDGLLEFANFFQETYVGQQIYDDMEIPGKSPYQTWNMYQRTSLVVSDSLGRFRVVVKKTRPNLGIAIEGGADTKQKLPRVINIAANGAAFEAGGLRVGQLILAVDGQKLDGHKHEDAARLIAGCWVSRSRPEVEFMVVERKPTAADVRRSSISLLSQM
ncbi:whirlin-like [Penaeus monodon]|uniref:whirlin-like n=1 Tax=Penaeus monodon TaxID=6687 RepID=UPI0018A7039E|nr:whirlin-like [Penaeus monodon]